MAVFYLPPGLVFVSFALLFRLAVSCLSPGFVLSLLLPCFYLVAVFGGADDALTAGEPAGDYPPLLCPGGVRDVPRQGKGVQEQAGQLLLRSVRAPVTVLSLPK